MVKGSAKQEKQNYVFGVLHGGKIVPIRGGSGKHISSIWIVSQLPTMGPFVMLFFDFIQFSAQYNALIFSIDSTQYSRMFTIDCVCMQGYLFQQLYWRYSQFL